MKHIFTSNVKTKGLLKVKKRTVVITNRETSSSWKEAAQQKE